MKKYILILSAVTLLAMTGCHTLDNALLSKQETVTPPTTNEVTGAVTPPVTNTIFIPKPAITQGLDTAKVVVSLIPPPYDSVAEGVLALAVAGLGLYARSRNGQLVDTTNKLTTANSIVQAVVTGVEAVGHPETKAAIQNAAVAAGVQADLHPLVQSTTIAMK